MSVVTAERAEAMARSAMVHWNAREPRLVTARENIVFAVELPDGERAALRLHRPGYQSRVAIQSELDWMAGLAATGMIVPRPLKTRGERFSVSVGGRVATCLSWIDGKPIGRADLPLDGGPGAQADLYRAIGTLIAALHNSTDGFTAPPGFSRPHWDAEGLAGARPLWGRPEANPALSVDESLIVGRAAAAALALLEGQQMAGADRGLIHADLMRENILRLSQGGLALIDFDDCGFGFRVYDLATALVQSLEEPALPALAEALVAGYRAARPLAESAQRHLPAFVMLRAFASAGWIATRAPADDPRQRFYALRALRMAQHFLAGRGGWPEVSGG